MATVGIRVAGAAVERTEEGLFCAEWQVDQTFSQEMTDQRAP